MLPSRPRFVTYNLGEIERLHLRQVESAVVESAAENCLGLAKLADV
jgi:hypothetical protein